jgi:hypothetical protein
VTAYALPDSEASVTRPRRHGDIFRLRHYRSSTATLDIASGLLDLTGVGGNSSWAGLITQSGGALVLQSGTLLVTGGPLLEQERTVLLHRAEASGCALTHDAEPRLLAGRWVLRGSSGVDGVLRFALPRGTREVRLRSHSAVPEYVLAGGSDHRRLGVAVARLWLDGAELSLTDARLGEGWHAPEDGLRWTDGDAAIAAAGASRLFVHLLPLLRYWARPDRTPAAVRSNSTAVASKRLAALAGR